MNELTSRRTKTYSQTGRAAYQRNSRLSKFNARRFNNPLRVFIERKYPGIFAEYTEIYEQLCREYPHKKNLERTSMFRQWLETVNPPETHPPPGNIINQALQEALGGEAEQQVQPVDGTNDSHGQQDPPLQEQGPSPLFNEIEELLNEIEAYPDIGDVIGPQETNEDEGIELNIEDEIYGDIEPLDYMLDVEPGDF